MIKQKALISIFIDWSLEIYTSQSSFPADSTSNTIFKGRITDPRKYALIKGTVTTTSRNTLNLMENVEQLKDK